MLGFNPALDAPGWDPRGARELLAAAGYPGGRGLPPSTIWSSVKAGGIVREHEQMSKDLTAVGITAEFRTRRTGRRTQASSAKAGLPVFLYAW